MGQKKWKAGSPKPKINRFELAPNERGGRMANGSDAVHLLSFDITTEPLDTELDTIPQPDFDHIQKLMGIAIAGDARDDVAAWQDYCRKYPDVPQLRSMLLAAYVSADRMDDADREVESTIRDFPDYLFAIVNLVRNLLNSDDIDAAERIIDRCYSVKQRYPDRNTFHISEVIAYQSMIAQYAYGIGDLELADSNVSLIEHLDDEHPALDMLEYYETMYFTRELLRRAKAAFDKGGTRKRRSPRRRKCVKKQSR